MNENHMMYGSWDMERISHDMYCVSSQNNAKQFFWDKFLVFLHEQKSSTLDYFFRNFIKILTVMSSLWNMPGIVFFWSVNYGSLIYKVYITF